MRFLRILPAVWPSISWLFSRRTRNMALGSSSTTCPRISSNSSLAIYPLGPARENRADITAERGKGKLCALDFASSRPMPSLFTIGYESKTQAEFLDELQAAGVELVLDVRAVA